ncbi:MAG: glycosyltransferase [Bacteroidetes bacterium]|nr:glycosyltransferase [Bacteroidota bacterium]HET6243432.1 glycosyltransferase [Bacteroidia bacterium]
MDYLEKHTFYSKKIVKKPEHDLGIVVVIPAFCEPQLLKSLISLKNCIKPQCSVEVIVVVNHSIDAQEPIRKETQKMITQVKEWIDTNQDKRLDFKIIIACDLPSKFAGVGLARKIGMDEAVRRFLITKNNKGIICCFDADSTCDTNYFTAIEYHFKINPKTMACSIYFEHPLSGDEFTHEVYEGILNYELHLRYYIAGLRFAGHPFAYHTIGSSMAVRTDVYQKQGGMNKRKAGEDFYFLHKIIPLGAFTELNATRIIPSPRSSTRVPFGTGRAINSWIENKTEYFLTYNPKVFQEMKFFLEHVDGLYTSTTFQEFSDPIVAFLMDSNFKDKVYEIRENSKDLNSFRKRFYTWFDGFRALKFVHFMRDNYFSNIELHAASQNLLEQIHKKEFSKLELEKMIIKYRKLDIKGK